MVDTKQLKEALKSNGVTIEKAANAIGINPATFYRRINHGGERFTVSEVGKLADLLNMSSSARERIFFGK